MNKFAALCLSLAAMLMTVESSKCWQLCMITTKYDVTANGITSNEIPEEMKECAGEPITCGSGSSCKSLTTTSTADLTIDGVKGTLSQDQKVIMCVPDVMTSSDDFCAEMKRSIESSGTFSNLNFECSAYEAYLFTDDIEYSCATGFGFNAFLATIVYFL